MSTCVNTCPCTLLKPAATEKDNENCIKGFTVIICTKYYYGAQCRRTKWADHVMQMEAKGDAYEI
jgi:hypothetical protein